MSFGVVAENHGVETVMPSKMFLPAPRPNGVVRVSLTEKIDRGVASGLALVTAPAGFGKTTLLAQWASRFPDKVAWLQLEMQDNNLRRFGACLVAALGTHAPQFGKVVGAALKTAGEDALASILTGYVQRLYQLNQSIYLVLDDFHLIDDDRVLEFVTFLLEHRPPQLHLLIASRVTPGLPIAKWRSKAKMVELSVDCLRFDDRETGCFLTDTLGLELNEEQTRKLHKRVEGWAAGLQLVGLSLESGAETEALTRVEGDHYHIFEYLTEEVLAAEDQTVRRFLLSLSILERFNASLCARVTGREDAAELLAYLDRANLFLVSLDTHHRWFRFHHLFGAMLRRHLGRESEPRDIAELHLAAARWYEERENLEQALAHLTASGDDLQRISFVERHALPILLAGDPLQAILWLESLPREALESNARLCLDMVWGLIASLQHGPELGHYLEQAGTVLAEKPEPALAAEIQLISGVLRGAAGFCEEGVSLIRAAFEVLPPEQDFARGIGMTHIGFNLERLDRIQEADIWLQRGSALNRRLGNHALTFICDLWQSFHLFIAGKLNEARSRMSLVAEEVNSNPERFNPSSNGLMQVTEAQYIWETGNPEEAIRLAEDALDMGRRGGFRDVTIFANAFLAWLNIETGVYKEAMLHLNQMETVAHHSGLPYWDHTLEGLRAYGWFMQLRETGNATAREALQRWFRESEICEKWRDLDPPSPLLLLPRGFNKLVLARYYLLEDQTDRAIAVLDHVAATTEAAGRYGHLLAVLVLQALAHHQAGNNKEAAAHLERALIMAEPEGWIRMFIAEGKPMQSLLHEAKHPFARQLLETMQQLQEEELHESEAANDLLSAREQEVLSLIARGMTNRQAADALFIAPGTVKKHLENIYGRLGVNKRTQAIARARDLGLL